MGNNRSRPLPGDQEEARAQGSSGDELVSHAITPSQTLGRGSMRGLAVPSVEQRWRPSAEVFRSELAATLEAPAARAVATPAATTFAAATTPRATTPAATTPAATTPAAATPAAATGKPEELASATAVKAEPEPSIIDNQVVPDMTAPMDTPAISEALAATAAAANDAAPESDAAVEVSDETTAAAEAATAADAAAADETAIAAQAVAAAVPLELPATPAPAFVAESGSAFDALPAAEGAIAAAAVAAAPAVDVEPVHAIYAPTPVSAPPPIPVPADSPIATTQRSLPLTTSPATAAAADDDGSSAFEAGDGVPLAAAISMPTALRTPSEIRPQALKAPAPTPASSFVSASHPAIVAMGAAAERALAGVLRQQQAKEAAAQAVAAVHEADEGEAAQEEAAAVAIGSGAAAPLPAVAGEPTTPEPTATEPAVAPAASDAASRQSTDVGTPVAPIHTPTGAEGSPEAPAVTPAAHVHAGQGSCMLEFSPSSGGQDSELSSMRSVPVFVDVRLVRPACSKAAAAMPDVAYSKAISLELIPRQDSDDLPLAVKLVPGQAAAAAPTHASSPAGAARTGGFAAAAATAVASPFKAAAAKQFPDSGKPAAEAARGGAPLAAGALASPNDRAKLTPSASLPAPRSPAMLGLEEASATAAAHRPSVPGKLPKAYSVRLQGISEAGKGLTRSLSKRVGTLTRSVSTRVKTAFCVSPAVAAE